MGFRRRVFLFASAGVGQTPGKISNNVHAHVIGLKARYRPVTLLRMRKALQIVLLSAISISVAVRAETPGSEDALAAYSRGDYKTALKLLGPMAEDGNTF